MGIDTSFSQNRNAHFSQTAALEENSGEIVQMVITNKHKENCSSNKLEVLGTETLLDKSLAASVPFAAVSTDQCTEVGLLLQRNSVKQLEKLGLAIKIQNDAFHRLKNNKQARNALFENPKISSQKVSHKLEDLKLEGLKEIANQMSLNFDKNEIKTKGDWIDILDLQIRSLYEVTHLVIGIKSIRLQRNKRKAQRDKDAKK